MLGSSTIGVAYPASYAPSTQAVIAPYALPDAYVDRFYAVTFTIEGTPWTEPTTWLLLNTVLPPCVTWNAASHTLSGTPMRVGTTTVTVRAMDATGRVITKTYVLTVRPTP